VPVAIVQVAHRPAFGSTTSSAIAWWRWRLSWQQPLSQYALFYTQSLGFSSEHAASKAITMDALRAVFSLFEHHLTSISCVFVGMPFRSQMDHLIAQRQGAACRTVTSKHTVSARPESRCAHAFITRAGWSL
jgi:hypothetical protein